MASIKHITDFLNSKKVELASEKVQLGRIDDLKKQMVDANRGAMKAIDMANAAKKPAEESLQYNKTLLIQFDNLLKIVKDLGLNDSVNDISKQMDQVKENIKTIDSILDALYKI